MNIGTRKIRMNSHYLAGLFIIALFSIASYLTVKYACIVQDHRKAPWKEHLLAKKRSNEELTRGNDTTISTCNLFSGRWVFDNVSYPVYKEEQCSVMHNFFNDFSCQKYGRKDDRYQKWRWQPHGCDLPRFNATELLQKIRGKRVVFVGDSLGRNQWTSLICLIESSLHRSSSPIRDGNLFVFQADEYNARIEFYWSPFLVESNCDDPYDHSNVPERIVGINAIEKHARHWNDADILVFDTFMWWRDPNRPFLTLLWGSFGSSDAIYKKMEMKPRLYEMGLNTLSDWLEININRNKTKLFFTSQTPYHKRGVNCYNETEPMLKEVNPYARMTTERNRMRITESFIRKLETRGLKVEFLNITNLSDQRKDGHPSIYKMKFHPNENKGVDPRWHSDCVHWCLPGVPDVWNHILYSYIINS